MQLQRQFANNSGLIVTLALLASAIFLYVTVFAPRDAPTLDRTNGYDFYGAKQEPEIDPMPAISGLASAPEEPWQQPIDLFAGESLESLPKELLFDTEIDTPRVPAENPVHVSRRNTKQSNSSAMNEAKSDSSSEMLQLPDPDGKLGSEDEILFNDASASIYPRTDYPLFDYQSLEMIGVQEIAVPRKPAVARRKASSETVAPNR